MSDDSNLKEFGDKKFSEIRQAFLQYKMNFEQVLAIEKLEARRLRKRYLALVDEGFTKEQALELCKLR